MAKKNLILDIPLEIRIIIYELTVITRVVERRPIAIQGFTSRLTPPPLAQVNRQLRREVIYEYYTKNQFCIELPIDYSHHNDAFRMRWFHNSDHIRLIKSLRCRTRRLPNYPGCIYFISSARDSMDEAKEETGSMVTSESNSLLGHHSYEDILSRMESKMGHMERQRLMNFLFRTGPRLEEAVPGEREWRQDIYHEAVETALSILIQSSVLGDGPIEAFFWSL